MLPNISRGNETMKFGQLLDYNTRNIFLEKSYTKCGAETSLRSYSQKLKLNISFSSSLLLLYGKLWAIKIY